MIIHFITFNNKIINISKKIISEYCSIKTKLDKKENEINNKQNKNILNNDKNNEKYCKTSTNKNIKKNDRKKSKCIPKHIKEKDSIIKINNPKKKLKSDLININKKSKNFQNNNKNREKGKEIYNNNSSLSIQKLIIKKNMKIEKENNINLTNNLNNLKNKFQEKNEKENIKNIDKIIKLFDKKIRISFFSDEELNSLEFKYAIEIDFRSYFQFYCSLLKQTHLLIFTFIVRNDYNIFLLKLSLFLISFILFFFVNALFFSDDSIHKVYVDEGQFNFIYNIPQIFYSTFVSQIISFLLEKLSLSEDNILEIKEKNNLNEEEAKKEIKKIFKNIKIKCIIFYIIGTILFFAFWYFLSAFCAVYNNIQISLIKDNFISFGFSMLYPFLFILLPGIFRIPSLRY